MIRPARPKQRPLIGENTETIDEEFSSTSSSPPSSPYLFRKDVEKENGRKRYYIPSSSENENRN